MVYDPGSPERWRFGGAVCSSRAGKYRVSVRRNRQICATCVPVVTWTR